MTHRGQEQPRQPEPETISELDHYIRHHRRLEQTHQDMADYFTESAAQHRSEAARFTAMRDERVVALGNVACLPIEDLRF